MNQFPLNAIKVDQSFVRTFDRGGSASVGAALGIGRSMGVDVIIEGVEKASMLRQARALGATLIQGYLIARPMSPAATREWLRRFDAGTVEPQLSTMRNVAADGCGEPVQLRRW